MKLEEIIKEAKELSTLLSEASKALHCGKTFQESEVQFRFDTIRGMMIIARSELLCMILDWEKEINHE